jgi:hypothetical protein
MHIVKSVGVMSVAKIMGLIYGCMGLIFVPIFLIAGVAGSVAGDKSAMLGGVIGIVLAILMPVLYGGMGFVAGAIGALLYNLFAGWVGGFELKLEAVPTAHNGIPVIPAASAPTISSS